MLIAIAAHDQKFGIGKDGDLPWRGSTAAKADMKHFMKTTLGHTVVMGRKTWESIPPKFRPLADRRNIVITRQENYKAEGAIVANDLIWPDEGETLFVIGGSEIYNLYAPYLDQIILTEIAGVYTCDTHWPIELDEYEETRKFGLEIGAEVTHYERRNN